MKRSLISLFCLFYLIPFLHAQVSVSNLLTENLSNPIGIDASSPQFSWQLVSNKRNVLQTAYECKVLDGRTVIWQTGKVVSGRSVMIAYAGSPLKPGRKYTWQVKVWDNYGAVSTWSDPSSFL